MSRDGRPRLIDAVALIAAPARGTRGDGGDWDLGTLRSASYFAPSHPPSGTLLRVHHWAVPTPPLLASRLVASLLRAAFENGGRRRRRRALGRPGATAGIATLPLHAWAETLAT